MKHILKLVLVVFGVVVYSCHSDSKKQDGDSTVKSNLQSNVVQSKNPIRSNEDTTETKLIFPKFSIKLHVFCVHGGPDSISKLAYMGDLSKVSINVDKNKIWNLTAKTDTLPLPGQFLSYTNIIELIPENKMDNFKISYSLPVYIVEYNNDKATLSEQIMNVYKPLKDSLNYFFRIRKSAYNSSNIGEVKKNLKLKDSIIKDKGGNGKPYIHKLVIYKNKICRMGSEGRVYLKIERFNGNKLIDTKFLIIGPNEGEDVED